jgi:hypothetical protein
MLLEDATGEPRTFAFAEHLAHGALVHDSGAYSITVGLCSKVAQPLVVKRSKWRDADLEAQLVQEARMATALRHNKIAAFQGLVRDETHGPMLVYERYSMTLKQAIVSCRKPSKDTRIQLALDLLEAVAWVHALSYTHGSIDLDHCYCRVTYPYVLKFGVPRECFLGNLSHCTPIEAPVAGSPADASTLVAVRDDVDDYAWAAACILYWDVLRRRDAHEWIDTYATRHAKARKVMNLL